MSPEFLQQRIHDPATYWARKYGFDRPLEMILWLLVFPPRQTRLSLADRRSLSYEAAYEEVYRPRRSPSVNLQPISSPFAIPQEVALNLQMGCFRWHEFPIRNPNGIRVLFFVSNYGLAWLRDSAFLRPSFGPYDRPYDRMDVSRGAGRWNSELLKSTRTVDESGNVSYVVEVPFLQLTSASSDGSEQIRCSNRIAISDFWFTAFKIPVTEQNGQLSLPVQWAQRIVQPGWGIFREMAIEDD